MKWPVLAVLLWFGTGSTLAQSPERLLERLVISKTAGARCYDSATGKILGSMLVRSPVLISPSGHYRAYTENEAVAFKYPGEFECANTARLFVAGQYGDSFKLVFLQAPERDLLLNSVGLVDWSPDGHYLLFELGLSTYGTDFGGAFVMLYDAYDGVFWPREFESQIEINHFGRTCSSVAEPLGFSPEGKIVLRIGPYFSVGEDQPDADSCVKKEGLWLLDPHKNTLNPLPNDYKVQHYGRIEEPAVREKSHGR